MRDGARGWTSRPHVRSTPAYFGGSGRPLFPIVYSGLPVRWRSRGYLTCCILLYDIGALP